MVAVKEHVRGGSKVRAHSRNAPGARRELAVLGAIVALVAAMHAGGGSAAGGSGSTSPKNNGPGTTIDNPRDGGTGDVPVIRFTLPRQAPQDGGSRAG